MASAPDGFWAEKEVVKHSFSARVLPQGLCSAAPEALGCYSVGSRVLVERL
jgi:hypothetical protein